ncbi:MAG TPA: hypothetical protein VNZ25_04155, partial [Candidatus Angelobacter sp.]|nr:hypothetical protein [Candidatus Angelobacter sp.]
MITVCKLESDANMSKTPNKKSLAPQGRRKLKFGLPGFLAGGEQPGAVACRAESERLLVPLGRSGGKQALPCLLQKN